MQFERFLMIWGKLENCILAQKTRQKSSRAELQARRMRKWTSICIDMLATNVEQPDMERFFWFLSYFGHDVIDSERNFKKIGIFGTFSKFQSPLKSALALWISRNCTNRCILAGFDEKKLFGSLLILPRCRINLEPDSEPDSKSKKCIFCNILTF